MITSLIFTYNIVCFVFLLHVCYGKQYQENTTEDKLFITNVFGVISLIFNFISVFLPLMHIIIIIKVIIITTS